MIEVFAILCLLVVVIAGLKALYWLARLSVAVVMLLVILCDPALWHSNHRG